MALVASLPPQAELSYNIATVGGRVHFPLHPLNKGREKPRWRVSWDRSSQSHPQPSALTAFPRCPGGGCSGWAPGWEHTLPQTTTPSPPSWAGADSSPHGEDESSPKSSTIPRLPPSSIRQAPLKCQPQLWREFKPFSSKPSRPHVSHGLLILRIRPKSKKRHKFHLEVAENKMYLKGIVWGADPS